MEQNNYQEKKDVVFIDAYNLIYRAFHGNKSPLTNPEGLPTNAIYTVTAMLLKLRKQFTNIEYALAVFDGGGNFRKELDSEYKANRKDMPEDLKVQMPYLREVFEILGWPVYQSVDVEADDVIGSLALRSAKKGFDTYIVSGDKDFRQIITDDLKVIDTMYNVCYTPQLVNEKMGVYPENVTAWLALVGDESDNVQGVDKVGKTTATKLLNTYGNLDNLIINKDKITGKVGENIREAIANGQLQKSLTLVTLKTDLDIQLSKKELTIKEVDEPRWTEFCKKMNFTRFNTNPRP